MKTIGASLTQRLLCLVCLDISTLPGLVNENPTRRDGGPGGHPSDPAN
jgi:hypothetical protein